MFVKNNKVETSVYRKAINTTLHKQYYITNIYINCHSVVPLKWKIETLVTVELVKVEQWKPKSDQGFIQAVLLMSVFEIRLSFQMLYFVKDDHKTILKWSWGSGVTVSFAAGPWQSSSGESGGRPCPFYVWKVNKGLK